MRTKTWYPFAGALVLSLCCGLPARAAPTSTPDTVAPYPVDVALDQEGPNELIYRRFPGGQRLYYYDLDHNGVSACNIGCDGPRPPVYAACSATPMGVWTIFKRYNGLCQWVYNGHPLYTFYHDAPNDPKGDGEGGVWHLLPPIKQP